MSKCLFFFILTFSILVFTNCASNNKQCKCTKCNLEDDYCCKKLSQKELLSIIAKELTSINKTLNKYDVKIIKD